MKFWAILKDSLRETLDVKLFYVMIGLSLLVALLVGSISYTPVSMERHLSFLNSATNAVFQAQFKSQPNTQDLSLHIGIENFQQINDRPEPWLGDYSFDYVITLSSTNQPGVVCVRSKEETDKIRGEIKKLFTSERLEQDFKGLFVEVKVQETPSDDPEQTRFHVTTAKGTAIKSRHEWFHEPSLFFGLVPIPVPLFSLGQQVSFIGDTLVGTWGAAFTMLLSTILTASFLPNMLSKGTVDLLLAKPIHRVTLFLYKFLGGLLFMFLNTVVIMTGIWFGIGIQSGLWIHSFLMCILVFTFQFAMFYAVSAFVAVLTRSAIVSILAAMMTWGFLVLVGWTHWFFIEKDRIEKPESTTHHWAYVGYDIVKTILPRYKDLDWLTSKMIKIELIEARPVTESEDGEPAQVPRHRERPRRILSKRQIEDLDKEYGAYNWTSSLTVSGVFIALMLALSCWRFAVKDY